MVTESLITDPHWMTIIEDAQANGDVGYGDFVAKWPMSYYRSRVRQAGMSGFGKILDVGCGFGQWTAALALENSVVVGVEVHEKRLATARRLVRYLGLENASFEPGNAHELPFHAESFDAIFCYGVFMFTDRQRALAEFSRVLKPGGKIYICTNGRGWWLKLAVENIWKNRPLASIGWSSFKSGRVKGMPNATDLKDLETLLAPTGWTNISGSAEGALGSGADSVEPVYPARYITYDCVIEFTANKPGTGAAIGMSHVAIAETRLQSIVESCNESQRYSFRDSLATYPMPPQPIDVVNNTNRVAVDQAVEATRPLNRTAVLKNIFSIITVNCTTAEEKLKACVTFAQKRFYHHFAGQPMLARNQMVLDPVATLMIGACRCGNVARFLIDLVEVNGFQARLLGGACHTSAEILLNDDWVLADASLFPPGIIPLGPDGNWIKTSELCEHPELIDAVPSFINYEVGHIAAFRSSYAEAAEPIEKWLREPILPSVGYFGKDFAGERVPGLLQRWKKLGSPVEWEADSDYGWNTLQQDDSVAGQALATIQRPEQVQQVRFDGGSIHWSHVVSTSGLVCYEVFLSHAPRGWQYNSLRVGETFSLSGEKIVTTEDNVEIPYILRGQPIYISIISKLVHFPNAFYLPSEEFIFYDSL